MNTEYFWHYRNFPAQSKRGLAKDVACSKDRCEEH